jgi:hypothetical protein
MGGSGGRKFRAWVALWCVVCMLSMQQHVYAQAVLAPVENFVVNRAVAGVIANRIAVARGIAANDATWLASAANDSVYKATMAGVSKTMTAANVASTVAGVGLAVVGAPVWLTIAASLGVLAVGAAIVAGSTKIEMISTSSGNQLRVTQAAPTVSPLAYSTPVIEMPSMKLGSQLYRDPSCFSSQSTCMFFPLLPSTTNFPYKWKPYASDTGAAGWSKVWVVAYTWEDFKKFYLADITGGDIVNLDYSAQGFNCYVNWNSSMGGSCIFNKRTAWKVAPFWEANNLGEVRLMGSWNSNYWVTPDNVNDTSYPSDYGNVNPVELPNLVIDPTVKPIVKQNLNDAYPLLSAAAKSEAVNPQVVAQIADAAWRNAAAQPGYQGQPYTVSNPVTEQDVTTWTQAHPNDVTKVDDLLRPATNATTYPDGVPMAVSLTYTPPANTPATSNDVNVINTPNVNVVNTVKVDFGTDPGVADPALESTPTGSQILQPLTSLFPELRSFQTPQHSSACPKPVFEVFGKSIVMDSQCTIAEQHRGALAAVMAAVWLLVGLFILLSA